MVQWIRLPANATNMGSIPRLGRFSCAAEQLSLCTTATEALAPEVHALEQEKPPQ